ncbi:hypothetical protein GCM10009133_31330 [Cocleimonas flava]|uniref:Ankyrin repeat protein n=1 Tax=Cocleimonas flava TaxID=634765 RepID=A0A4R1FDU4_9GAMM|nr:ankyrin repeat domain-containing protein [Cocleimonas flava]TCJ89021.1 ankyrin repeat protein [Cocleimonas flava]
MKCSNIALYTVVTTTFLVSNLSASANSEYAYDMSDIGALQSEYQKQLKKPKAAPAKRMVKKPPSRPVTKSSQSNQSFNEQVRLLNAQQQSRKQQQLATRKKQLQQQTKKRQMQQLQQKKTNFQQRPVQASQNRLAPRAPAATQAPAPTSNELFDAASRGDVRTIGQLINRGVNVNSGNAERETALHMAAAKGHYSAVIYLINHGANINARTVNNWLPIHHATRFRHAQIANYLKQRGSSPYAKTSDGLSAIDMAKATNDRRILGAFGVR